MSSNCKPIGQRISNGTFNTPPPASIPGTNLEIPGTNLEIPHVFLGDQAFQLKPNLMTPYSQKKVRQDPGNDLAAFNLRHTRARRTVENAFGLLNNCWRIFNTPINMLHSSQHSSEQQNSRRN